MNSEAERILRKAKVNTLLHNPFFGYLCLHLELIEDPSVPTMCTNGDYLRYNPDFVIDIAKDASRRYPETALVHELEHICWGHLWRRGQRDKDRWNIAADAVINADLVRLGYQVRESWVNIPGIENMSAEEVYNLIRVIRIPCGGGGDDGEGEEQEGEGSGGGAGGGQKDEQEDDGEGGGAGEEDSEEEDEGEGQGEGKDSGKDGKASGGGASSQSKRWNAKDRDSSGDVEQPHDEWGKNKDGKPKNSHERAEDETKWKTRISQARQLAKQAGQGLGKLEQVIDELLEPKLNWEELLRDFIISTAKTDYRLIPPSKRHLHLGMYLPSIYGEEIEIGFAIDTSGSMSDPEVLEGFSETRGVCQQFASHTIHWYQADWGVQEYKVIDEYTPEMPKVIKGRGGTSFIPVIDDIRERKLNISCLVYFTDLEGPFPETPPPYPVLWLATTDKIAPFGVTIRYQSHLNGR